MGQKLGRIRKLKILIAYPPLAAGRIENAQICGAYRPAILNYGIKQMESCEMPKPEIDDPNPTSSLVREVDLFRDLEADQIEIVFQAAHRVKIMSEAYLFHQGDLAERLHVLLKGSLKLTQVTPEGQQVLLHYVHAGQAFAILAVLGGMDYPASAQAVEDSLVLTWDRETINDLMIRFPRIALRALEIMARQAREFQDRIRELSTERVERRLARALLRLAKQAGSKVQGGVMINLSISRQDLAEMTGTTLFTVSRTLSQWESQGLIETRRGKILIRSPHELVAVAEELPRRKP